MKKILCAVLSAVMIICLLPLGAFAADDENEAPRALLGDVDLNGVVAPADARLALRASVGLEPEILPETDVFTAADADFDGKITSADARSILRAAVGLEDLADRLPESEALTEEALSDLINACMLDIFVEYQEGSGASSTGFTVRESGTAVVPYGLIHHATVISVGYPVEVGCRLESVLAANPGSKLALLKIGGDIPYLPVNRTWYGVGDTVYSTDYLGALHRLTIVAPPAGADIPEQAICVSVPEGEHSYYLGGYAMVDRFGRAIGYFEKEVDTDEGRFAYAIPLSLLPSPEEYNPRSAEEFSRDEWRITPVCPVEAVTLVQYGTGLIPLYMPGRWDETVKVVNPRTDLLDVAVETDATDSEFPILRIIAKKPCENIPVTVRVLCRYEITELTLTESVAQDGYVNMVGAEFLPDPGVIWETLPTEVYAGNRITLTFNKSDTGLSGEELFYSYTDYLIALGYEYVETEEFNDSNRYRFRMEEYGITVDYTDTEDKVSIGCYFDES